MIWRKKIAGTFYMAFVKLMENAFSKKFLVFITATVLLVKNILPSTEWMYVALAVLGVTSALDYKQGTKDFGYKAPPYQPQGQQPSGHQVSGPPEIP